MKRNKGFSLLEVLVAFSIMAIVLGVGLRIFSSGLHNAVVAEEYTLATQIAESLMAKVGIESELEVSESRGTELDKYHWQVVVTEPEELDQAFRMLEVRVRVEWDDGSGDNNREVELLNLKLLAAGV